jgi:hypothetical protein
MKMHGVAHSAPSLQPSRPQLVTSGDAKMVFLFQRHTVPNLRKQLPLSRLPCRSNSWRSWNWPWASQCALAHSTGYLFGV